MNHIPVAVGLQLDGSGILIRFGEAPDSHDFLLPMPQSEALAAKIIAAIRGKPGKKGVVQATEDLRKLLG